MAERKTAEHKSASHASNPKKNDGSRSKKGDASHAKKSGGHSAASSHVLTDREEIREWAESRGGKPAMVKGTGGKDETGIIRLMFPDAPNHKDDKLEEISWDEFFEKFDESDLALMVQDHRADGGESLFNKLVSRETADAREHGDNHASRHHKRE